MPSQTTTSPPAPRQLLGPVCIALGIFLILASLSGSWGPAYGQTVVTPTPSVRYADPVITKTGDACCIPGGEVIFTIVATNVGNSDATNVFISDTLPVELTLVEVTTSKGTVGIVGNHFKVWIGTIAPGEIVTVVVKAIVSADVPPETVITNTAYLRSSEGNREASWSVVAREVCETPGILPPTGGPPPEPERGETPLGLFLAGLFLLLLGIVLTVRDRRAAKET